jgi:hypothetical protein
MLLTYIDNQMFEINMTALLAAFGIAVLGFVLGSLATFVRWMKSEDGDLKRGYIEIAGNCYQLQPMEDPLLSHRRRICL